MKIAKGLKETQGEEFRLAFGYIHETLSELYGYGDNFFESFVKLDRQALDEDIPQLVGQFGPDLIHSHNAPDYLTVTALNTIEGTPIIHDLHDSLTMRNTGYQAGDDEEKLKEYAEKEKIANERSDGRIYVSRGVRDYVQQRYDVDPLFGMVFPNYIPEDLIPHTFSGKISEGDGEMHVVYAGTISSKVEGHHYDLREIFKEISGQGVHIHVYASREDEAYMVLAEGDPRIHYHGHLDQKELLLELTRYDYGWAGFNDALNSEHLDVVLPNKAFEYIACGLPILTFPHKTLKGFVERHHVGIALRDLDDLLADLKKTQGLHESVNGKRYDFTVEKNIDKLIDYYAGFLEH
ncbi:MAG: glycosyltransferase [Candidatus Bathyarchaeota archaeon]